MDARGRRAHAGLAAAAAGARARRAAPDRRRPSPLRDGASPSAKRIRTRGRRTFAVLVSTRAPGPRDLPDASHRRAPRRPSRRGRRSSRRAGTCRRSRCTATAPTTLVETETTSSTREAVERFAPEGVTYTPSARRGGRGGRPRATPRRRSSSGRRRSQQVCRRSPRRGKTMPQKSTYFFPKLISGLLFHPL